ncbi:MAG: 16S rRNA (cytosine967-C5)-methyltransferase [Nitrospirae bacterium]|nr:MAG: 16S rRNA (cytosine967-C5)-methyltransferase [Nitrospirota bacterium]
MTPRQLALKVLEDIFQTGLKPKQSLDAAGAGLEERDRAFLMQLVYGVLRYRDCLDWLLSGFLTRPEGLGAKTIDNLRMAVYQIEFMRVPEWAAVDEAVTLEKRLRGKHGLVNAVLRSFLRKRPSLPDPLDDLSGTVLAMRSSHPLWLVQRWIKRFGIMDAAALCEANNAIPSIALRVSVPAQREDAIASLAAKGIAARPSQISPAGIVLEGTARFEDIEDAMSCPYFVQDEAAQMVSMLLAPEPGQRILDACSAPGGKATHLAEIMQDRGEVVAVDQDDGRLKLLRENIIRLGLHSVTVCAADAFSFSDASGFDHVLVDAPCSALGTIRRNPDVRYRHTLADLLRLQHTQMRMLSRLSGLVREGGTVVYAVCSTEPEEGEDVVRFFLQEHANFSIIKGESPALKTFFLEDDKGFAGYRTFPHRDGMDGFYAARLKRLR